jgi:hypothetical protein
VSFSAWGGWFSVLECLLMGLRGKEDLFNPIAAGTLTGAVIARGFIFFFEKLHQLQSN